MVVAYHLSNGGFLHTHNAPGNHSLPPSYGRLVTTYFSRDAIYVFWYKGHGKKTLEALKTEVKVHSAIVYPAETLEVGIKIPTD